MTSYEHPLFEPGAELAGALKEVIDNRTDANGQMDVRVIFVALGTVLGCCMRDIENKELKIDLAKHFCRTFFGRAGLQLKVEVVS